MSAIAKSYWRSIQRGVRAFAAVPASQKEAVRVLARRRGNRTAGPSGIRGFHRGGVPGGRLTQQLPLRPSAGRRKSL